MRSCEQMIFSCLKNNMHSKLIALVVQYLHLGYILRWWTSTKHGRRGQRVTVLKWLIFGVDLNRDVDLGSVFIARQRTDARYWYSKSVCLSVRLFVCPSVRYVPVPDENGLTYRHSFFSPYGSPIILFLSASNIFTKFRRGHPLWWR